MRFLADYVPLLLFFFAFKWQGIWVATAVAIAASIVQIAWFHWRGKVSAVHWLSLAIIVVFGGDAVEKLFTNRLDAEAHPYFATIAGLRVSSHFLVRRDGALLQFVRCAERAWHAGESVWRGRACCNDFSIGIELEGTDELPYAAAQYVALARLARALFRRYGIRHIVGHSDIAPGRKTDPGPAFDWHRLRRLLGRGGKLDRPRFEV